MIWVGHGEHMKRYEMHTKHYTENLKERILGTSKHKWEDSRVCSGFN
jgi:hypothetical protein